MSVRELIELFNRFVEEDLYKADALYYMLLCWDCEGARLSYIIKYGSDYKHDQVIKELHSRDVMNIVGSICEISDIVIDHNVKFLEFFEEDTKSKIRYLSASSMKLLRVIYRTRLYESLARHDLGSIMYSSIIDKFNT